MKHSYEQSRTNEKPSHVSESEYKCMLGLGWALEQSKSNTICHVYCDRWIISTTFQSLDGPEICTFMLMEWTMGILWKQKCKMKTVTFSDCATQCRTVIWGTWPGNSVTVLWTDFPYGFKLENTTVIAVVSPRYFGWAICTTRVNRGV